MSVCRVIRRWDVSGSIESERNQLLYEVVRGRVTAAYNVYTTSHLDGPVVILSSPLTPKIGNAYCFDPRDPNCVGGGTGLVESNRLATCVKVSAPVRLSRRLWRIEAEFDTNRVVATVTDDPFRQPWEISLTSGNYEVAFPRDGDARPYVNSSGRAFDPPPVVDEKPSVWTIVRNEAATYQQQAYYAGLGVKVQLFTSEMVDAYKMKCNKYAFQGRKIYAVRINDIRATRMVSFARPYYQVTYEIEIRPVRLFYEWVLDKSFTDKNDLVFRDPVTTMPLANETLLNGRGESLRLEGYANLAADLTVLGTVLTLDPARLYDHLPLEFPFELRIGDEIVQVTGYHDDPSTLLGTVDVIRGYRGTTPVLHATGARANLEPFFIPFRPHQLADLCPLNLPLLPTGAPPAECPDWPECPNGVLVIKPDGSQAFMGYDQYVSYCALFCETPLTRSQLASQDCADDFTGYEEC